MIVTTIGIDLAKSVFQVHGVNSNGHAVLRKPLKGLSFCLSLRICRPA
jgi:transposase